MKRCEVVFATPTRQWSWEVMIPDDATVGAALELAREAAGSIAVPWDGPIGIFGALCNRNAVPRDGDRIEIYRPLKADPKESRRARVQSGRAARDRVASQPGPRPRSSAPKRVR